MTPDVNIIVIDFKSSKGNEMISLNEDGSYTILINARLSYSGQLKAYEHAMNHIETEDFQKNNVQTIEHYAHYQDIKDTVPEPAPKYLERIKQLQKERRKIQRQMREDRKRVQFIMENCDMYKRAEHNYLYGNDL